MRGRVTAVIDPRDGIGASLAINAALQAGDMVCMLGDRVMGGQPSMTVDFLGGQAVIGLVAVIEGDEQVGSPPF